MLITYYLTRLKVRKRGKGRMNWIELYCKIQTIGALIGYGVVILFILFWIVVAIINKVMK